MHKRRKPKPITFGTLVGAAKKALLALQVARVDGLRVNSDGRLEIKNVRSHLRMWGSHAPRELDELLTYHYMHQLRKEWVRIFFPYFQPFIEGLTMEKMWRIIVARRISYRNDWEKRQARKSVDITYYWDEKNVGEFKDSIGCPHKDKGPRVMNFGGHCRIWPMLGHKYTAFMVSMPDKRAHELTERFNVVATGAYGLSSNNKERIGEVYAEIEGRNRKTIKRVSVADAEFSNRFGVNYRIAVADGKLCFLILPNRHAILAREYCTERQKERIEYWKRHSYNNPW